MPIISIKNLTKHFGKVKAVDGISFDVEKGQIFGFLGPNGAGKTTTIRCLMDFIRPDSGEITILEKNAHKDAVALKKDIGYESGDTYLYEKWTGNEHFKFIERIRGKSKLKDELIKNFKYDPSRRIKHLSTGNKQKLAIILALMYQPKVLILDEVTSGLDPLLQNAIYDTLEDFREQGSTIFMSSHNLHEVEVICDHVGIIKDGKMIATESVVNMKQKKVYHVTIYFKDKFNPDDFKFPNTKLIRKNKEYITLQVKKDLNPIVKKIADHNIADLEISLASLEDIFLEFYK